MNTITNPEVLAQEIIKEIKEALIEKPMNKKEAAKHLGIHWKTLERKLKSGAYPQDIAHYDKDRTVYFFPSELNQYLKSL